MCRQHTCLASRLLIYEALGVIEKQKMERQPLKFKKYVVYILIAPSVLFRLL